MVMVLHYSLLYLLCVVWAVLNWEGEGKEGTATGTALRDGEEGGKRERENPGIHQMMEMGRRRKRGCGAHV